MYEYVLFVVPSLIFRYWLTLPLFLSVSLIGDSKHVVKNFLLGILLQFRRMIWNTNLPYRTIWYTSLPYRIIWETSLPYKIVWHTSSLYDMMWYGIIRFYSKWCSSLPCGRIHDVIVYDSELYNERSWNIMRRVIRVTYLFYFFITKFLSPMKVVVSDYEWRRYSVHTVKPD